MHGAIPVPVDHSASEISEFEAEESKKVSIDNIGVISKNQFNKSIFARVAKIKERLAFPCEEHRDSR